MSDVPDLAAPAHPQSPAGPARARLARMAWRNLWRNRRRTILTLVGISFGLLLAIIFIGVGDSSYGKMIELAARTGSGNVAVQHRDFLDLPSLKRSVHGASRFAAVAREVEGVERVEVRVGGAAMLATARKSYGAFFMAIDPASEDETSFSILSDIHEGALFAPEDPDGVVLGAELAENLKVRLGQKVVYTLSDKHGEMVSGLGRVRGLLRTNSPTVDRGLFLVSLQRLREIVGYDADEAGQVAVFVHDQRQSGRVARELRQAIARSTEPLDPQASVLTWDQAMPDLANFIAIDSAGNYFFQLIVMLLVAAGIFNTIFVSVIERLREFGIMMAIGFRPLQIFALVVWETLWVGLLGLCSGALLTAWPYYYLNTRGVDVSSMIGGSESYEVSGIAVDMVMRSEIVPIKLLYIGVAVLAMTLLSGLYPAWRASRVVPVEAIKLV